jgi:hypothetical protein
MVEPRKCRVMCCRSQVPPKALNHWSGYAIHKGASTRETFAGVDQAVLGRSR